MADAYQKETEAFRYLLEDGSGVYLLEPQAAGWGLLLSDSRNQLVNPNP